MTFLQPFILWGLPLALLPIIIHLLNRMRYRTQKWAAMSFLFSANRASTRYAKLRQFIILACRVCALAALVLAVARPLAGGWLGWALSPSPDVIVIVLDHSASMEAHDAATSVSRREQALRAIASAAAPYADRSRFVIIENAMRKPQEIAKPDFETLSGLAITGPTNTSADMPAMLDTTAEWLSRNQAGLTEVWIASDLQRSNWQPESNRWQAVMAKIAGLKQTVRVRLLALTQPVAPNVSVAIVDTNRRDRGGQPQFDLTLDLERSENAPATLPVAITLDDARSNFDASLQGQTLRIHRTLTLDPSRTEGWGKIELPPDGNPADDAAYFVYGAKVPFHTALLAADERSRRILRFAAAPAYPQDCEVLTGNGDGADWKKYALVAWQGALPGEKVAKQLQDYVQEGGAVVFFPPAAPDTNSFAGIGWGPVEEAPAEQVFGISHWEEQDGPLAKSEEGLSLPVNNLNIIKRQGIIGGGLPLANFADTKPFLVEKAMGKGKIFFCATLLNNDWSGLSDGRVLVPMIQRMEEAGGKRLTGGSSVDAGDPSLMDNPAAWISVDAPKKDIRFNAGVYRNGSRMIAVNRPVAEDSPERVEKAATKQLFGPVAMQFFEERGGGGSALQGEIWRSLLITMILLMLAEGILSLPQQAVRQSAPATASTSTTRETPKKETAGV